MTSDELRFSAGFGSPSIPAGMTARTWPLQLLAMSVLLLSAEYLQAQEVVIPDDSELVFKGEILLPEIVRFGQLPDRMFLEPALEPPPRGVRMRENLPAFMTQLLRGDHDSGVYIDAVRSLRRMDGENLGDVSDSVDEIRDLLSRTDDRNVRRECIMALVQMHDGDSASVIAPFCRPDDEVLCLEIEPVLAEWQSPEMAAVWIERIRNPRDYSTSLIRLACSGLAQSDPTVWNDAVELLITLLQDSQQTFAVRYACADALGRMAPDKAWPIADKWMTDSVQQRLLAVRLMNKATDSAAISLLNSLCDDPNHAVATRAWDTLAAQSPDTLLPRLKAGRNHDEANIRYVAIDMMKRYPSEQHCEWLQDALADIHIGIRNTARRNLLLVASSNPELKPGIHQRSGNALAAAAVAVESPSDTQPNEDVPGWQQLEQSLLLLGQLKHPGFQLECSKLLEHKRAEVFVTAAWLLHLMPRKALSQDVAQMTIKRREAVRQSGDLEDQYFEVDRQICHLIQAGALTREDLLLDLAKEQFDKESGLSEESRAAGMWVIGFLREGINDKALVRQLFKRVFDVDALIPESDIVRQTALISIGRMDAAANYDEAMRAFELFGARSGPGAAAQWIMEPLGRDEFPALQPEFNEAGPWPIAPADEYGK